MNYPHGNHIKPAPVLSSYVHVGYGLDRLARNVEDLRRIVRELNERRVSIEFVKNRLIFAKADLARAYGISREPVYQYLRQS